MRALGAQLQQTMHSLMTLEPHVQAIDAVSAEQQQLLVQQQQQLINAQSGTGLGLQQLSQSIVVVQQAQQQQIAMQQQAQQQALQQQAQQQELFLQQDLREMQQNLAALQQSHQAQLLAVQREVLPLVSLKKIVFAMHLFITPIFCVN